MTHSDGQGERGRRSRRLPRGRRRAATLTSLVWVTASLATLWGAGAAAQGAAGGSIADAQVVPARVVPAPGLVVGGSYSVAPGTTVTGDLTAVGATVAVDAGATLEGNLVVVGGAATVDGSVAGDVRAYGGALTLGDRARVGGDVSADYAAFRQAAGAVVAGSVHQGRQGPVRLSLPEYVRAPAVAAGRAAVPRHPADMLLRAIAIGLLASLVMAAVPARVRRVRDAMLRSPWRMGFDGLLTAIVAVVVLALLAVTLIGIPLTILGAMLVYAAVLFGWIAVGDAVGEYLAGAFERHWSEALRVGIGAFTLALVLAVLAYVPVLGGLLALLLSLVALGAVRATRAGGRERGARSSPGARTAPG